VQKYLYIAIIVLLNGCASPGLYQWGSYEKDLHSAYKNPQEFEGFRLKLEIFIKDAESKGQKVPPGIYAEIGTLYLQMGSADLAIAYYKKERDAWPESKGSK
jgi:hypothetical protein